MNQHTSWLGTIALLSLTLLSTVALAQFPDPIPPTPIPPGVQVLRLQTSGGDVVTSEQVGTPVQLVGTVTAPNCQLLVAGNVCQRTCLFRSGIVRLRETSPHPSVIPAGPQQQVQPTTVQDFGTQFSGSTITCVAAASVQGTQTFRFTVSLSAAAHQLLMDVTNQPQTSNTVTVTWTKMNSVTAVAPVVPATAGSVQVRAQVAPAFVTGPAPTGTVSFIATSNGMVFHPVTGSVPVDAQGFALGTFVLPASSVPTSIIASYSGDANLNLSSQTTNIASIGRASSTTSSVGATPNPATPGEPVTLTATVIGFAPSGTVEFRDGSRIVASATGTNPSGANGSTTFQTSTTLGAGTHNLIAAYGGDANNLASSSPSPLAVTVPLSAAQTAAIGVIIDLLLLDD